MHDLAYFDNESCRLGPIENPFWVPPCYPSLATRVLARGLETRMGVAHLRSLKIGYSLRVRRELGAGSRSALPLRFSVIFKYGGLIP
jgi:hypothetical protein